MPNKTVDIPKIVAQLKLIPTITAITSTRIYSWEPWNEQSWIYLVVNAVTQQSTEYDKTARIEIRCVWHDATVTKQTLVDLQDIIVQRLCYDIDQWLKNYNWFIVYSIKEWWYIPPFIDDKYRNILIKDFILSFT